MSQHDYDIANQAGLAVRSDINSVLQAIVTNNSGATTPTDTFTYQWWADTTSNILKRRNAANDAWIDVMALDGGLIIGTDVEAYDSNNLIATTATGSAPVPSGTTAQRDGSPVAGYFRYNSTLASFEGYNGTDWGSVGGGATGGGTDEVFAENDQNVTSDYTLPVGRNASSAGEITIDSGVTVTISTGSRWVVI